MCPMVPGAGLPPCDDNFGCLDTTLAQDSVNRSAALKHYLSKSKGQHVLPLYAPIPEQLPRGQVAGLPDVSLSNAPTHACSSLPKLATTKRVCKLIQHEVADALAGCKARATVTVHVQGSPWAWPMQSPSSLTIDEALQGSVGEFGRGQIHVLGLASLTGVVAALINFSFAFTSIDPFTASFPECLPEAGEVCNAQKSTESQFCVISRNAWEWRYRCTFDNCCADDQSTDVQVKMRMCKQCKLQAARRAPSSCMCRDHSVASQWDLICSQSWMLQLANSGFFLGSLGGLMLFQQVAEELGEQQPFILSPSLVFYPLWGLLSVLTGHLSVLTAQWPQLGGRHTCHSNSAALQNLRQQGLIRLYGSGHQSRGLSDWSNHSYSACTAGRKRTLGLSCTVTALSGMFSAVAPSFWWYFVFRVFTGATVTGIISTSVLLAVEPVGPNYRGTAILSTGMPTSPLHTVIRQGFVQHF